MSTGSCVLPLQPVGEDPFLPILASEGCQQSLVLFLQSLPPLSHSCLLYVSLPSHGLLRTPVMEFRGPIIRWVWPHLNYICKYPTSKSGHIPRDRRLGFPTYFGGGHHSTHNTGPATSQSVIWTWCTGPRALCILWASFYIYIVYHWTEPSVFLTILTILLF